MVNVNLPDFSIELINQLFSSMSVQQEEEFQNQNNPIRCILQSVPLKSVQNIHQHPIITIIQNISKQHHHAFATLQQKCLNLQQSISQLAHLPQTLAERVQRYSDDKEGEILNKMKMKQAEFIIGELKNAIAKLNKKQEAILEELHQSKRLVERYSEEKYKMEVQNEALLQKIEKIEAQMKANASSAITINHQQEAIKQKQSIKCKSEECLELEDKLSKISSQLQCQMNVNKSFRIQLEQKDSLNSQLQIKYKQQSAELVELQSNYKQIASASKDSDVSLYKQLQQHKLKEIVMIKQHKAERKMYRQQLRGLADFIANGKYYFVNTQLKEQIQQIKQLYEKSLKRKLQHETRQLDYIQHEYKRTKQIAGQLEQKVHQMQKAKSVIVSSSDKSLDSSISFQRNCSQNGSYLAHHHSHESNDEEKHKHLEEKYKSKVQGLRKEIKIKNAKIDELEKLEASQFDQNKEKLLQFELIISYKNNQIRKYELQAKEKEHESEESHNRINDLQNKAKQLSDKLEKEKDANLKLIDSKVTNYEEKIKVLKNHLKQLEAREQQKTMKYNLLKNKHEKYQLQASESLNRKKMQIDQLLKQNSVQTQRIHTLEDTMKQIQMNPMAGNDNQNANEVIQSIQKQLQQKIKQIKTLKSKIERLKQNRKQLQLELSQQKQQRQMMSIDLNRRISEMKAKQSQLIDIINYKNIQGNTLRESMIGQQLILQEESKLKLSIDTMTDQVMTCQTAINTDLSLDQYNAEQAMIMQDWANEKEEEAETYINKLLVPDELEQNFDIGDEDEVVNIGQSSNNLQVKESFNVLRHSIQKILNEQDITLSVVRLLPRQLEDDFNDFVWYIKQKIHEIRNSNNLTFIMAEGGSQPSIQEIQTSLLQFLSKPSVECIQLKKIIQEKEFTITSLMSEKTEQQNTISQQLNAQQQTQRLYLQQFSVLKKEIQCQKQTIDKQTVYYESIKNILKKMMAFWIDDEDNFEDFEDNLKIVTTIYKFSLKELDLLKQYLAKYKKIKHIK